MAKAKAKTKKRVTQIHSGEGDNVAGDKSEMDEKISIMTFKERQEEFEKEIQSLIVKYEIALEPVLDASSRKAIVAQLQLIDLRQLKKDNAKREKGQDGPTQV